MQQDAPIEPGKLRSRLKAAALRWPGVLFMLLGAGLGLVELPLLRGNRYDWVLKLVLSVLGACLGGLLGRRLGLESDETEQEEG